MFIRIIELNCRCGNNFSLSLSDPSHGHLFVRFKSPARVLTSDGYKNAEPGDFIFFRADEHTEYSSGNWKFVHDYFRFYLEKEEEELFSFPTSTLFKAPLSSKAEELLQMMMREFYSANEKRELSMELLGKLFLLSSAEHIKDLLGSNLPKIKDGLLSVRVEMLSSPEKDWTVELLAERACLSPSYFQGIYKKTFGKSPINDLIEARIKKAESYLLSSNKKEAEIANLCGYNNLEHFIRQFRRHKGISPSDFRKKKF